MELEAKTTTGDVHVRRVPEEFQDLFHAVGVVYTFEHNRLEFIKVEFVVVVVVVAAQHRVW
jgi:hypothetical protein